MKTVFIFLLVIPSILIYGCTSRTPTTPISPASHPGPGVQAYTTSHALPSLVANWSGPARGYTEGLGPRDTGLKNITRTVTEQNDLFFRHQVLACRDSFSHPISFYPPFFIPGIVKIILF